MWFMFTKQHSRILALIVVLLGYGPCIAFSFPHLSSAWHTIAALNLGAANSATVSQAQNIVVDSELGGFYDYSASQKSQTVGLFGGFFGVERSILTRSLFQVGVEYNQLSPFDAKGTVTQGADVQSESTYNYQYSVSVRQALIEGKWLYMAKRAYHPYLLGGVGCAFNNAYHYYTNVPLLYVMTRMYQNHSTLSLTYALGAGIDFDFAPEWRIGVGYRFSDFGKVNLGTSTIDETSAPGTISQSHLYVSELVAQLAVFLD